MKFSHPILMFLGMMAMGAILSCGGGGGGSDGGGESAPVKKDPVSGGTSEGNQVGVDPIVIPGTNDLSVNTNTPPQILNVAVSSENQINSDISLQFTALDQDNDSLIYKIRLENDITNSLTIGDHHDPLLAASGGASIATPGITVTHKVRFSAPGTYGPFVMIVEDGQGGSDQSSSFNIVVKDAQNNNVNSIVTAPAYCLHTIYAGVRQKLNASWDENHIYTLKIQYRTNTVYRHYAYGKYAGQNSGAQAILVPQSNGTFLYSFPGVAGGDITTQLSFPLVVYPGESNMGATVLVSAPGILPENSELVLDSSKTYLDSQGTKASPWNVTRHDIDIPPCQ